MIGCFFFAIQYPLVGACLRVHHRKSMSEMDVQDRLFFFCDTISTRWCLPTRPSSQKHERDGCSSQFYLLLRRSIFCLLLQVKAIRHCKLTAISTADQSCCDYPMM